MNTTERLRPHPAGNPPNPAPARGTVTGAAASAGEPPPGWKATVAVIWSGQAVSVLTTYAATFAAMWHVTATTGSALYVALAGIAALAPTGLL
ncbi:MAG: hypothetical protein LBG60_12815, partial [Bifidobacteriaceae bacterium]|nr:hypothetical protein [Bifidobacteriaceae bacterium]